MIFVFFIFLLFSGSISNICIRMVRWSCRNTNYFVWNSCPRVEFKPFNCLRMWLHKFNLLISEYKNLICYTRRWARSHTFKPSCQLEAISKVLTAMKSLIFFFHLHQWLVIKIKALEKKIFVVKSFMNEKFSSSLLTHNGGFSTIFVINWPINVGPAQRGSTKQSGDRDFQWSDTIIQHCSDVSSSRFCLIAICKYSIALIKCKKC